MKRMQIIMSLSLLLAAVFLCAGTVSAAWNPEQSSSLTLQYVHDGQGQEGLGITSYRIAELLPDGTYALTGAFTEYPVNITGVTSQAEWREIASTLAAYAAADGIRPTCTGITDEMGTIVFEDILPGMYLTLSVKSDTVRFETFLTAVPRPTEDGAYRYDVTAVPKYEPIPTEPSPEPVEYSVVKLWKDTGYTEYRPESITVDILKDGKFHESQELSSENNWSYRWTAPDDGSIWQIAEREVPEGYTVTVTENGTVFYLTNITVYSEPTSPQTGTSFVVWQYSLWMCAAGGILLLLAVQRKERRG